MLASVWSFFICSPCVCVGSLRVLWFPPIVQKHADRWTGYAQVPLSVNLCVYGTLQWNGVQSGVKSPAHCSWDRSGSIVTLTSGY